MSTDSSNSGNNEGLIFGLNDRPNLRQSLFAALQHLLAIYLPIITPPLLLALAMGLDPKTTQYLIGASLLVSGVATFIQVRKVGPIGSGILSIQGTSFSFVPPLIAAGKAGGLPMVFGLTIAGSFIEIFISRFHGAIRRAISPLVSGIVVTLIGLTLIGVAVEQCAGGAQAKALGEFGSPTNLTVAASVILTIIIFNNFKNIYLRMGAITFGLVVGYIVSFAFGTVDFSSGTDAGSIIAPLPLKFGLSFDISLFVPVALIYVITVMETIGDLTATSVVSGEPVEGDLYYKRISGGVLGDGINSLIAGLFGSMPNTTFSQNNGIIQLTGIASRKVGYFIAGMLALLGLCPFTSAIFSAMPAPVLGGATLLMFGTVAAVGIRIISLTKIDARSTMIMAISFGCGIGVVMHPEGLSALPPFIAEMFSSGIASGGIAAIVANLVLPRRGTRTHSA
ncbi:MAG: purine permease [Myxococcales bacterium]|nr:purine permease [Myxococcales bacterium]